MAAGNGELTPKQAMFVKEYLLDLNATQAATRAGYSARTANEQGARLLANASVQAEIQKAMALRSERTDIDGDYVLRTIHDTVERCRQAKQVTNRKGEPIFVETAEGDILPAYTFDAAAVLKGCELLGKNLGIWKEVGSKDNPLQQITRVELVPLD